jgi:hypothetical protein
MSRLPPVAQPVAPPPNSTSRYSPAQRPTWLDFCFVLLGVTLSLVLTDWSGFTARGTDQTPAAVAEQLVRFLPALIFLPVGLLLFWPVFYLTQWVRGRREPLSSGEWLWGVAWLAVLPWIAWVGWQYWDTPPEFLEPARFKRWILVGYAVGILALGSLALLITLIGMVGRWRQPWTHNLSLVLLIWPALPLGACLAWGIALK